MSESRKSKNVNHLVSQHELNARLERVNSCYLMV